LFKMLMIKNELRTNKKGLGPESSWGSQNILQIEERMYLTKSLSDGQRDPTFYTVCSRIPQYFRSITIVFFKYTTEFVVPNNTGRFVMFSVITNIYNKKTKGPTLMEFFTATGKLKKFF